MILHSYLLGSWDGETVSHMWQSFCLSLLNAGITDISNHTQPSYSNLSLFKAVVHYVISTNIYTLLNIYSTQALCDLESYRILLCSALLPYGATIFLKHLFLII